ncbi:MAG: TIGR03986 family CRISPR-associated RAMP protein [Candidatus Riflebacteria bacterium]|nr:TIGR03986 family CRISPR-associated RAMP protein [Candidatus Riflebacteria bacterium]
MIPKHNNPTNPSATAIAPYNFVPLPEKILIPDESSSSALKYSGEIDLSIKTETDLYVRCGVRPGQEKSENPFKNPFRQEFFHRGNPELPVIPGSSFRGMLRSLVEILSFSRMADGFFSDQKLNYKKPNSSKKAESQYSIGDHVSYEDSNPDTADFTQNLFGRVTNGKDEKCIRGRVSVGDFPWESSGNGSIFHENDGRRVPQILSGPKPASFQMYLTQPSGKKGMLYCWDTGKEESVVRGFKRYWIKTESKSYVTEAIGKNDTQHTIMRPVKPGNTFGGRITFTDLSLEEIGALMVALEPGDELRHQIGMGKPLGMGAVKITLKSLSILDPQKRYGSFFDESGNIEAGLMIDVDMKNKTKKAFENLILSHFKKIEPNFRQSFWLIPRLADLRTMMDWNTPVAANKTEYVRIGKDGQERQWKDRYVLPTPGGVRNPAAPQGAQGNGGGHKNRSGSQRPVPVTVPVPRQAPPPVKGPVAIATGQPDKQGKLKKSSDGVWTAEFEGDSRPVVVGFSDPKMKESLKEGTIGLFYIREANKKSITARLDKLLK